MQKSTPEHPPIENAADYIDALIRPNLKEPFVRRKTIEGRRMRDKYLDGVMVVEVAKKPD